MRKLLLLWLAILLLHAYKGFSQRISAQVCISVPQAQKLSDSLRVLPVVRQEAAAWQKSSGYYKLAADSLGRANSLNIDAVRASQRAFTNQVLLMQNEAAKAEGWKRKARRRGFINWLGLALAGGAAYLLLTH